MRKNVDSRPIVEAAYAPASDAGAWLETVVAAARDASRAEQGVFGAFYDASRPGAMEMPIVRSVDMEPWREEALRELNVRAAEAAVDSTFRAAPTGTTSQLVGADWHRYVRVPGSESNRRLLEGLPDSLGINATDPTHRGVVLVIPLPALDRLAPRELTRWARVAAHIAAGWRLWRASNALDSIDGAEAILEPTGHVVHAEPVACAPGARVALRAAARAIDRARTKETDPDAALELWRALTRGRWSVVDRFDTDGRRFFIAQKNDPDVAEDAALTRRERQVVEYAVLGHTNKMIAYALGISVSRVGTHVVSAMRKLGVRSRVELVQTLAAVLGS